ncbi:unnamed protein product [Adineta steineri]|uniref:Protein-tyrosine-phosphatase n=1 Tax=Adineta steineri TaxID=433720 RepID=A0A814PRW5_9BILA|nr:unnamed protein product [Adineta steineri]CAF3629344.1 unnamed protein product [Adineta steineri]
MANFNRMTFLMAISEITPQIFISGQIAATLEQVQRLGITYIVNVALESSAIVYPKSVKLEKYDILDFPNAPISNYFNTITDKIHDHLTANKQHKVLVHCMAGISRSTTIVLAYLIRYMNLSLREAYLLCKKHRPICFPNLGFWNQLIAYESQLRRENSVKMIPTQYGNVPDVAFEEIKQYTTQQQQQQPGSIPIPTSSYASTISNPASGITISNDIASSQTRSVSRDVYANHSSGLTRSRSLAGPPNSRPSVAAASTYISNPAYQTPMFTTNRQTFLAPTRFGVSRLLNNNAPAHHNSFSSGSTIYASNRHVPLGVPANVKHRFTPHHPHHHPHYHHYHTPSVATNSVTETLNNDQQRSRYDTTYRSSFIKPLAP